MPNFSYVLPGPTWSCLVLPGPTLCIWSYPLSHLVPPGPTWSYLVLPGPTLSLSGPTLCTTWSYLVLQGDVAMLVATELSSERVHLECLPLLVAVFVACWLIAAGLQGDYRGVEFPPQSDNFVVSQLGTAFLAVVGGTVTWWVGHGGGVTWWVGRGSLGGVRHLVGGLWWWGVRHLVDGLVNACPSPKPSPALPCHASQALPPHRSMSCHTSPLPPHHTAPTAMHTLPDDAPYACTHTLHLVIHAMRALPCIP